MDNKRRFAELSIGCRLAILSMHKTPDTPDINVHVTDEMDMGVWVPDDQRITIYGTRYSSVPSIRYSVTGVQHGLTLFPAWIGSYIPYNLCDEVIYPFPNFNGVIVEVWEWISNFIPDFTGHVITYPWWV